MRGNRLRKLIDAPDVEQDELILAAAAESAAAAAAAHANKHRTVSSGVTAKKRWNGTSS